VVVSEQMQKSMNQEPADPRLGLSTQLARLRKGRVDRYHHVAERERGIIRHVVRIGGRGADLFDLGKRKYVGRRIDSAIASIERANRAVGDQA